MGINILLITFILCININKYLNSRFKLNMKEINFSTNFHVQKSEERTDSIKNEEPNKKTCKKIIKIVLISLLIIIIIVPVVYIFFYFFDKKEISSVREKRFTDEEKKVASYNTVIKLNNIVFPTSVLDNPYNGEHIKSYYNFTYYFFNQLEYKDYSPISLYSILINIYMAISDKEQYNLLNKILGLNNEERILFYSQIFNNNYISNSRGEIKISNGAFYNSDIVKENSLFIDKMTKTYTECYKLSYKKDFKFISDWINKSFKKDNNNKDLLLNNLGNSDNIGILFFSNLYFKQNWKDTFIDSDTYKDIFYIDNDNKIEVNYMKHSYYVDKYYDYGKYISIYDYYSNYYSIQYIIPKSINDNILELIGDNNFIYENEKAEIIGTYITLSVPKFKIDNEIDFVPILKKIGFGRLFNERYSTLNNAFIVQKNFNYYLSQIKQRNQVELNEDGTSVKSTTFAKIGALSSAGPNNGNGIEVKLDQPFIYIIRDIYTLPIFVGYIKDPNY